MNTGKVVLGLLAGAGIGALLGVLFAPQKGDVTRRSISDKTKEYSDLLKQKFTRSMDDMNAEMKKARKDVSDYTQQARAKGEEVKRDVHTR
jgi:gas vesicle protein